MQIESDQCLLSGIFYTYTTGAEYAVTMDICILIDCSVKLLPRYLHYDHISLEWFGVHEDGCAIVFFIPASIAYHRSHIDINQLRWFRGKQIPASCNQCYNVKQHQQQKTRTHVVFH